MFGIYRDTDDIIWQKHKGPGRAWARYLGDVPVATAEPSRGFVPVVNPRGRAYALRNARRYLPTKRDKLARLINVKDFCDA